MVREIYFAGGCFWGTEHYFKQIEGVVFTQTGFANGNMENPTYKQVYTDTTGFAETVLVEYDNEKTTLEKLVRYYFCSIDPLSLNKQGEDVGTRYRTGIYYKNEEERAIIAKVYDEVEARLGKQLAVELAPLVNYYPAEDYHQDYLDNNPTGYCHLPLKIFRYPNLVKEIKGLICDEEHGLHNDEEQGYADSRGTKGMINIDTVSVLANISSLLSERLKNFWTGFYLVNGEKLVLGPFQGSLACTQIPYGKGVCGKAWETGKTLVVPDVESFPGHIACSSLSRSEIVVPVFKENKVVAVLDIDSKEKDNFDEIDRVWLEEVAEIISKAPIKL